MAAGRPGWPRDCRSNRTPPRRARRIPRRWPSRATSTPAPSCTRPNSSSARVIDARAPERYRGDVEPLDPVAGHIPGAGNRPFALNLQADGRFKPADQLRAEWLALLGGTAPASVVHSCGSGVSACHNLLAMEYAGLAGSRLYAPSWSGWVSDAQRPVERG
ncbi:rhodanese-like domain-containing protein [Metallibacterium sp.]|uniref:sulfurtransferase n=1 Tax=Metallibacterium sp. TaxID=2940281 RepID=UPI0031BA587D